MENLMDQFGSLFETFSGGSQTQETGSSTSYLYKYRQHCGLKQEERRLDHLNRQKSQRNQNIDISRGITQTVDDSGESKGYKRLYVPGFGSKPFNKIYNNRLMLSEWMVEKPFDFETNWYAVPCPKGKRVIVVHAKNLGSCYDKFGNFQFSFSSSFCDTDKTKYACTILDCVWSIKTSTFYVLDVLMWNDYSVVSSQTEFRHYWLEIKFSELPTLTESPNKYDHRFYLLPKINCTPDKLCWAMSKFPYFDFDEPPLDGWLFYHKEALYEPGTTPLVGWLKPYMVNEILGDDITVHNGYIVTRPEDYTDQSAFIKQFDETVAKYKKSKRRSRTSNEGQKMDTSNASNSVEAENGEASKMDSASSLVPNSNPKDSEILSMECSTLVKSSENNVNFDKLTKNDNS